LATERNTTGETTSGLTWRWRASLSLALVITLAACHLAGMLGEARLLHGPNLLAALEWFNSGDIWHRGPELGDTRLYPGGPLNYWLYSPARLVANPALGVHLMYFILEAAALLLWVLLARRAAIQEEVAWIGALLLSCWWVPKIELMENGTVSYFFVTAGFGVLSAALARPRPGWMLLAGLLLGASIQVHPVSGLAIPAAMVAVLAAGGPWLRRLAELLGGWLMMVALCWKGMNLDALQGDFSLGLGSGAAAPGVDSGNSELQAYVMWLVLRHLPVLLGAGVAVAGVVTGRRRPANLLLVIWLAMASVLVGIVLTGSHGDHGVNASAFLVDHVVVQVAPGLACLAGLALWQLFCGIRALLRRWRGTRLPSRGLLAAGAGAALVCGGVQLWGAAAVDEVAPLESYFQHLLKRERGSREARRYFQTLLDADLRPSRVDSRQLCAAGRFTDLLLNWPVTISDERPSPGMEALAIFPGLEGGLLQSLPGARRAGPLVLVPGRSRVHAEREGTGSAFTWPESLKATGMLLLIVHGTARNGDSIDVQVEGTKTLASRHLGRREFARFYNWRVLQVGSNHPRPGKRVRLKISPGVMLDNVCLIHVPGR